MISRDLAIRAAQILEREAKSLRESYTTHAGKWVLIYPTDRRAKREHDEMVSTAAKLRRAAG